MVRAAKNKAIDLVRSAAARRAGPEIGDQHYRTESYADLAEDVSKDIDRQRLARQVHALLRVLVPGLSVGPVWLRPEAGHGDTVPGIVLGWSHDRIHSALDSGWVLTVAVIPFDGDLLIDYAKAERLIPVRDATPVDPTASAAAPTCDSRPSGPELAPQRRRRRHIWVNGVDHVLQPGLIVEWRRHPDHGWQALIATPGGRSGGALIQWRDAKSMRPLTDDGWMPQPR